MSIRAIEHHSKWNTVPCLPKWNFYSLLRTYCCGFSWRKLPYDAKTFRFMVCIVWMVSTRWSCSKITIFLLKIEVKKGKAKCRNDFTELWALSRFLPVNTFFVIFSRIWEKKLRKSSYVCNVHWQFQKDSFQNFSFLGIFFSSVARRIGFSCAINWQPWYLNMFLIAWING